MLPLHIAVLLQNGKRSNSPLDVRSRYGTAAANVYSVGTQAFLSSMAAVGSNNTVAGTFSISPSAGQYGWFAAPAALSASGVTFTEILGPGGWSGAGLAGNNTSTSPSVSASTTLFTDVNGTVWRLFRQDYANAADTFTTQ